MKIYNILCCLYLNKRKRIKSEHEIKKNSFNISSIYDTKLIFKIVKLNKNVNSSLFLIYL